MPQAAAPPRPRVVCKRSELSGGGTASMPVREKGRRSPGSQPACPFSRPQPPADAAKVRGFSPIASGFTAETDWLLEGDGFEPSVPRQKDLCKGSPPIASTEGADRRESGESADLAPSLRHPKLVERLDGVRDAAGENSGCGVALQVLGSLPVRSSRPFIGEIPRKTRAGSTVPVSSDKDGRAAKGGGVMAHAPGPPRIRRMQASALLLLVIAGTLNYVDPSRFCRHGFARWSIYRL